MLNKTLVVSAKKIKSARKYLVPICWLVLLLGSVAGLYRLQADTAVSIDQGSVIISHEHFTLTDVFTTDAERVQGLSGRSSMASNAAALFVFEEPTKACFWMKNMQFTIDMIWLDSNQEVIKVARSVDPASYPEAFCSEQPAKYVIETSDKASQARLGETVQLQLASSQQ